MLPAPFELPAADGPVAVTLESRAAVMAAVTARFRAKEGFALATINLDHLVKLAEPGAFADAYHAHEMVVADGNPVVWLSRLAGRPVALVPGSDLVIPLARLAAQEGVGLALLGSTEAVLDEAGRVLAREAPGLEIAARLAPGRGFDPESEQADAMLAELGRSGARLCFLALGAPKQECLAARGRQALPQIGFVSIGAGLDFLAGAQTRAPLWVRRLALEWAWRLGSNPGRLAGRYLRCALILPQLVRHALRQRQG